ncbi:MAG: glycosyltransferase family 39 protein [Streptococcaceae bacterium]|jgi:4-amino-4-deoxy-L-arabinose transferase-like glycosyltransferase|nr:glycosyltransferase family 39 protein [Streptococcaceae bacterium]
MAETQTLHRKTNSHKAWFKRWDFWLVAILLLALFLNAWGIWDAGTANAYYTAAIKSMTESWKAFWYGSLDPNSYITVDKPPVALWFMALSAKVFGFHGWSVVLPSVLFGVASSFLMYLMVKPKFGAWAGRIAAFIITITPIAVADNRTNNMDATLVFFLLLGIWFLQKAVAKKQLRYIVLSFLVIGIAYNVKMLEAFMILPAMVLYYVIAIKVPWKKMLVWGAVGLAVLGVSSFTYTVIVDATPASERPYIGSTEDNSLLDLAFGYNGTERLLGQTTGTGGAFPGMNSNSKDKTMTFGGIEFTQGKGGNFTPPSGTTGKGGSGAGGGIVGAFNIGTAGVLRVFQSDLGPMASWFLPAALIGIFVGLFATRRRKQKILELNDKQKETLLWAGWLIPVVAFFDVAGFFHPYYLNMLAAPIAALTAIALVELSRKIRGAKEQAEGTESTKGGALLAKITMALVIFGTLFLQAYYAWSYYPSLVIGLGIASVLIALWWFLPFGSVKVKTAFTIAVLSVLTGWWALTPTLSHESAQIPTVGPSLLGETTGGMARGMSRSSDSKVLSYTEKHQGTANYLFATVNASTAAPYIIDSGKSVMALGGFNGTDPSITLNQFKELVKEGKVKYFLAGGGMGGGMGGSSTGATGEINQIVEWIEKNAKTVSSVSNSSSTSNLETATNASNEEIPSGAEMPSLGEMPSIGGFPGMQAPSGGQMPSGGEFPGGGSGTMNPPSTAESSKLSTSEQKELQSLMNKERKGTLSGSEKKELQSLLKKSGMSGNPSGSQEGLGGAQGGAVQSTTLYDLTTISSSALKTSN